jgi:hypothetical protein
MAKWRRKSYTVDAFKVPGRFEIEKRLEMEKWISSFGVMELEKFKYVGDSVQITTSPGFSMIVREGGFIIQDQGEWKVSGSASFREEYERAFEYD